MLEKAKKKGPVFECPVNGCSQVGGKLTMHGKKRVMSAYGLGKHSLFLLSRSKKVKSKSITSGVKPHKESKAPVFDVVRVKGTYTTVNQQKKWDTTATTLYCIQRMPERVLFKLQL